MKEALRTHEFGFSHSFEKDRETILSQVEILYLWNFLNFDRFYNIKYQVFYDEEVWERYFPPEIDEMNKADFYNLYPLQSDTQQSFPKISHDNIIKANFCFPIDLFFSRKKMPEEEKWSSHNKLSVLFEVFSLDKNKLSHFEGFAILRLDAQPGFKELVLHVMKPQQSLYERIKDYFVGSYFQIHKKRELVLGTKNQFQNYTLNEYVKTCELVLRVNQLHISQELKQKFTERRWEENFATFKTEFLGTLR